MTTFGPDISSFQHGLDLATLPDASFVMAKCTEGTFYTDADYDGWRRQAAALGKLFIPYHFISAEDPAAQAAHLAAHIGDKTLPTMIDWEDEGAFKPTFPQLVALVDAFVAAGINVRLSYAPRWHWQEEGSPDLTPLTDRGQRVVASSYPGGSGSAAQIYPGDGASGWGAYGGQTPLLYQFTNQAADGGQRVDFNAYRGTVPQLAALLGAASTTSTGGTTMANPIPPSIGQMWPEIAGQFTGSYEDTTAIIWADGGARAAALYAKEARDAVNALAAKVSTPPAVDVDALAAALAPQLAAGATADDVAAAVVAHLAGQLAKP